MLKDFNCLTVRLLDSCTLKREQTDFILFGKDDLTLCARPD